VFGDQAWQRIAKEIIVDLAGEAAEALHCGRHNWQGAKPDYAVASEYARYLCSSDAEILAFVRWARLYISSLLEEPVHWAGVEALANALVERRGIPGKDAKEIIRQGRYDYLFPPHSSAAEKEPQS
jgi:hypothetical protein